MVHVTKLNLSILISIFDVYFGNSTLHGRSPLQTGQTEILSRRTRLFLPIVYDGTHDSEVCVNLLFPSCIKF